MDVSLLTPAAGAVGVVAIVPVAVLLARERRSRRLCSALGLAPPGIAATIMAGAAIALTGALLALAAAQPVVATTRDRLGRVDAEALFVFDISRSMAASERPGARNRLERAKSAARRLRARFPDVPTGVATLIDRSLPHVFPTVRADVFDTKVERALQIEQPPPERLRGSRATNLSALIALATQNFFSPRSRYRVVIVFTDGESLPVAPRALGREFELARITPLFVHVWGARERVFDADRRPLAAYRPDPVSRRFLDAVARGVGGKAFGEGEIDEVAGAALRALGTGPKARQGRELRTLELGPYAVLAAGFPLLLLLWSRNIKPA
jgi:hypothetical protein